MTRDSPLLKFVDAADLSPSGGGGDALIPAGMPAGSCSPGAACDTESPFCAVLAPQPIAVREQKFNYILAPAASTAMGRFRYGVSKESEFQ